MQDEELTVENAPRDPEELAGYTRYHLKKLFRDLFPENQDTAVTSKSELAGAIAKRLTELDKEKGVKSPNTDPEPEASAEANPPKRRGRPPKNATPNPETVIESASEEVPKVFAKTGSQDVNYQVEAKLSAIEEKVDVIKDLLDVLAGMVASASTNARTAAVVASQIAEEVLKADNFEEVLTDAEAYVKKSAGKN